MQTLSADRWRRSMLENPRIRLLLSVLASGPPSSLPIFPLWNHTVPCSHSTLRSFKLNVCVSVSSSKSASSPVFCTHRPLVFKWCSPSCKPLFVRNIFILLTLRGRQSTPIHLFTPRIPTMAWQDQAEAKEVCLSQVGGRHQDP